MSTLLSRARGYLADAAQGFQRAPVEVALALFIAVTFSWAVEIGDEAMTTWLESTVPALLVLAGAWTATLLHALGAVRERTRWALTLAVALVAAAYALWVVDFALEAEAWRAVLLLGAAVLWLLAVPALGSHGDAVDRMRRVDGRILLRLLGVGLYAVALYAGLALALAAVNNLFELELEGEIYAHVAGWIYFVLVPWVVFGGLDDYVRPAEAPNAVAGAVQRITLFLVPPLLALYLLILYAYVVRIALTGELPKNLVSPMVLAAGALTALALLLFDPPPARGGLARALRLGPALFLPLAPLGLWALLVRIDQYGWTEFRAIRVVVLAAFTALAAAAAVQLARRRPFALHVLPITLAAIVLLAVVGPWSTLALARRDQQARLEAAIDSAMQLPLDTAAARRTLPRTAPAAELEADTALVRTVPADLFDRIQDGARYLHQHFGADALPEVLAAKARDERPWNVGYTGVLGLRRAPDSTTATAGYAFRSLPHDVAVALEAGTAWRVQYRMPGPRGPGTGERPSLAGIERGRLVLRVPPGTLYADVAPLLAGLAEEARSAPVSRDDTLDPALAVLVVRDSADQARGQLLVLDASVGEGARLQHLNGVLLLRAR